MHLPKQAFHLHHWVEGLVRIAWTEAKRLEFLLQRSDLIDAHDISEKHLIYLRIEFLLFGDLGCL